ncbi:hypothetical protein SS50377_23354 [Spironucleus salmonicida]|uniref:Uncharacterized protein n=1 Tax=Spironucleus salmonicida TaxID=348837 RepID=V6LRN4_9EUKA|nr:hypothetical protein SS50377_23354 [Spironucleus salmonicida]|eukprot:EST47225.1 Hypothetical protein SS50377_12736 [Spironucleus salmonicida]
MKPRSKNIIPVTPIRPLVRPLSQLSEVAIIQQLKDEVELLQKQLYREKCINSLHTYLKQAQYTSSDMVEQFEYSKSHQDSQEAKLLRKITEQFEVIINDTSIELGYNDEVVFFNDLLQ